MRLSAFYFPAVFIAAVSLPYASADQNLAEAGLFTIRNGGTGQFLGLGASDSGASPVVSLPSGTEPPQWSVSRSENEKYTISFSESNDAIAAMNGLVYAFSDGKAPEEWDITPYNGLYTFSNSEGSWTLPNPDSGAQVALTPVNDNNENMGWQLVRTG